MVDIFYRVSHETINSYFKSKLSLLVGLRVLKIRLKLVMTIYHLVNRCQNYNTFSLRKIIYF